MTWNYRIATKIVKLENSTMYLNGWREFLVIECYYNEDGIPVSYVERNPVDGWESINDLIGTIKKLYETISKDKPIINLDNFPNEFTETITD